MLGSPRPYLERYLIPRFHWRKTSPLSFARFGIGVPFLKRRVVGNCAWAGHAVKAHAAIGIENVGLLRAEAATGDWQSDPLSDAPRQNGFADYFVSRVTDF